MMFKKFFFTAIVASLSWMLFCCTHQDAGTNQNTDADQKIPVPADPISLAPGTVRVTGVVLGWEEKEKVHLCTFRIEETHGYGSATPPLPSGSEVKVEVSKFLLKSNDIQASELLEKGNIVKATIRFQEPRPMIKDAVSWRAVQIQSNKDKRRDLK